MVTVLEELSEEIVETDIQSLLTWYGNIATLQRMGYLLDTLGVHPSFAEMLYGNLGDKKIYPVLLSPRPGEKPGSARNRWKVDANVTFESDL